MHDPRAGLQPKRSRRSALFQELMFCRCKALDQPSSTIDVNCLGRDRLILHKKRYSLGSFIWGHQTGKQALLCDVAERFCFVLRTDASQTPAIQRLAPAHTAKDWMRLNLIQPFGHPTCWHEYR
jgi:hypothetical protein